MEAFKKGEVAADVDFVLKNTAQDFIDAASEELAQFKPASIITGNVLKVPAENIEFLSK